MKILKAIAVLLSYPNEYGQSCSVEVVSLVQTAPGLSDSTRTELLELTRLLGERPLLELQEEYVDTFDRTRSLSLHLFEHIHGDSRERGAAMSQLSDLYASQGFTLTAVELPDYLPALCELASVAEEGMRQELLADAAQVFGLLEQRLLRRGSKYAALFSALIELSRRAPVGVEDTEVSVVPESAESLDQSWEDRPVEFGLGAAHDSCDVVIAPRNRLVQLRKAPSEPAPALPVSAPTLAPAVPRVREVRH